jgi:transposase
MNHGLDRTPGRLEISDPLDRFMLAIIVAICTLFKYLSISKKRNGGCKVGGRWAMRAIKLPPQNQEQLKALEALYQTTKEVRLRPRAQMMLLAAEQGLSAPAIAVIVPDGEQTVRRWMKRYMAEGIEGLKDAPKSGNPGKVTAVYQERLVNAVRRRPRRLDLPFSTWTLQRLADYLAETTGIRVEAETVRLHLAKHEIVMSRPQPKISSPDPEYRVKKRRLKRPVTS